MPVMYLIGKCGKFFSKGLVFVYSSYTAWVGGGMRDDLFAEASATAAGQ